MKRRWGIVGSMVSVGGVLILIKILGFVRQMVVATVFGATADTDLVTLSQSFVGNAQYVLTQALLTAMVPIYVRLREEKPSSAGSFATDVLKSGTLISGAIALVLDGLFPPIGAFFSTLPECVLHPGHDGPTERIPADVFLDIDSAGVDGRFPWST